MNNTKYNYIFLFFVILFSSCKEVVKTEASLFYDNVKTQEDCDSKDGTWYNGECWKYNEDPPISSEDIDSVVAQQMKVIQESAVKINGNEYPINFLFVNEADSQVVIIFEVGQEEYQSLLVDISGNDIDNEEISTTAVSEVILFNTNLMENQEEDRTPFALGKTEVTIEETEDSEVITLIGKLNAYDSTKQKEYEINSRIDLSVMGAGTSVLTVKENELFLEGILGTKTYVEIQEAIEENPNIKTIVFGNIDGSMNDDINVHTGRLIRNAGLNTKVLKNSEIASGGVDLFCAGVERIVEKGAKIGIHSWCCAEEKTAIEIPKNHPAHRAQIDYFTACMGEKDGVAFYFHTLSAAPFDDISWMTDEDIIKWKVATKIIEN